MPWVRVLKIRVGQRVAAPRAGKLMNVTGL